jgi:chromatin remodeling complex protein RSC6
MTKKQSAFMKPVGITPALAEVVGKGPLPRTEITKKVWEYIRKYKLQDATNRQMINPDEKLGKVIGNKPINMFQMTSKIAEHIHREPVLADKA